MVDNAIQRPPETMRVQIPAVLFTAQYLSHHARGPFNQRLILLLGCWNLYGLRFAGRVEGLSFSRPSLNFPTALLRVIDGLVDTSIFDLNSSFRLECILDDIGTQSGMEILKLVF